MPPTHTVLDHFTPILKLFFPLPQIGVAVKLSLLFFTLKPLLAKGFSYARRRSLEYIYSVGRK